MEQQPRRLQGKSGYAENRGITAFVGAVWGVQTSDGRVQTNGGRHFSCSGLIVAVDDNGDDETKYTTYENTK